MGTMASQISDVSIVCSGADLKKTSKLRVIGLCEGTQPVTGGFPSQRAGNAENVSIWWRHYDNNVYLQALLASSFSSSAIRFSSSLNSRLNARVSISTIFSWKENSEWKYRVKAKTCPGFNPSRLNSIEEWNKINDLIF